MTRVNAKTRQRHDYGSPAWRSSYERRAGAERSNARVKDRASIDVGRGWCRLFGATPLQLFLICAFVCRNLAVTDAFEARQAEAERRAAAGMAPRTRRRRRRGIAELAGASTAPP